MSAAVENPTPTAIAAQFTKTGFVCKKERRERAARFIFGAMALLMILPLALIVGYLFIRALPVLSFDFLFKVPIHGMRAGGIWPACRASCMRCLDSAHLWCLRASGARSWRLR